MKIVFRPQILTKSETNKNSANPNFCSRKSYINSVSKGLSEYAGEKIKPSFLSSVVDKNQFLKIIKGLKEPNYTASEQNIASGIFCADLHSHSVYSDGHAQISDLFEQICEYANKISHNTGNKFLFALTDHNEIGGVKEFLRLIAQNCEKAKNVLFIPASELSFANECKKDSTRFKQYHSEVQCPELLIYGINPFSAISKNFFSNLFQKREKMTDYAINEANKKYGQNIFSKDEYVKYFLNPTSPYCMFNQHWQIINYLKVKSKLVELAQKSNDSSLPQKVFEQNKNRINQLIREIHQNYINKEGLEFWPQIQEILKDITPKLKKSDKNEISGEYLYEDLVDFAKRENAILSFAHPLFTIQNYNPKEALTKMRDFTDKSQGTLVCAEKFHQAYPPHISEEEKYFAGQIIDKLKLINIGGRDNHRAEFIN